jgi:hypothetical protein
MTPDDESVARERIAMLELSAVAHEQEGRAVMAGECRRSARALEV